MKTFKNLVIGGIENKVVNLILITIIVISAAFTGMTLYQNKMLEDVNAETIGKQQQALTDITNGIMNDIVDQSMDQTTELKAQIREISRDLGLPTWKRRRWQTRSSTILQCEWE